MATNNMKPIRVHIMGREYALRVREGEESTTRKLASQVNARMKAFMDEHPEQAALTTSVITALAMAEEVNELREALHKQQDHIEKQEEALKHTIAELSDRLTEALPAGALPVDPEHNDEVSTGHTYEGDVSSKGVSSTSDGHPNGETSHPAPSIVPQKEMQGDDASQ